MCCFMLGTLWNQMRSRSPNHHITGLTLIPTQKRGGVPLTKWTTQADGLASPTALYLHLEHKDANKIFIVSHLATSQFLQMKTTLQFVHMEGENFLPEVGEGGRRGLCEEEGFQRGYSYIGRCAK